MRKRTGNWDQTCMGGVSEENVDPTVPRKLAETNSYFPCGSFIKDKGGRQLPGGGKKIGKKIVRLTQKATKVSWNEWENGNPKNLKNRQSEKKTWRGENTEKPCESLWVGAGGRGKVRPHAWTGFFFSELQRPNMILQAFQ